MEPSICMRPMRDGDWPCVAAIFASGIAGKNATFETVVPPFEEWDRTHRSDLRFVAEIEGTVIGWVAASPVSERCCFSGVVEDSIYLDERWSGRGLGLRLLTHFLTAVDEAGVWTVQAGIFPENLASIALHRACGFRIVGTRERLGKMDGRWRDVVLLERRGPLEDTSAP